MNPIPNPFFWGIIHTAFFLGSSLGDRTKFTNSMLVCSNITSIEETHKEADAVVLKAMMELKNMIFDPVKGTMAPAPGGSRRPIVMDKDDEVEIVDNVVEPVVDDDKKAMGPRRSKCLQGRHI
ncbi:hypothetical protein D1007_40655 [Hordeum vulgare]|nr:hypothetical protein D1007_40655 [Hordeum vulgare]